MALKTTFSTFTKFLTVILFFAVASVYGQSIAVTNVATTPVCSGNTVTVTFRTTSGNGAPSRYDTSTSFSIYLSNSAGGSYALIDTFTLPTATFTGGNGGVTNGLTYVLLIPAGTPTGTGYRVRINSSNPTDNTSTVSSAFTINAGAVSGSVGGATTVCNGTNSTALTLTGHSGTIQWQSSSDNVTFNNISGATAATYTATNLTSTTYYRAVLTNGTCTATTASVTMNVNPTSVAGSISGAATVCPGTNSTILTLSGQTGTIQWQSSSDNITFNNISGQTATTYTATNLTVTTYYRAVVTSGVCASATTPSVTMTVNPASVAGSISGATSVCSGTNAAVLTLSGQTGTIQWQSSSDNVTFTNISGETATTYTATNLTADTYYRAVVTSGACASATTASVMMTVSPVSVAGSISGATTVCSGSNSTVLTLSGYVGAIQWQSSTDNIAFADISGANSATYTATNLTVTTYYRAVVTSGVCSSATTFGSAEITVSPVSAAGSISGATTVCSGTNSTVLTLSGQNGTIQWQSSTDNVTFSDISGETATTYTATNLTVTTYYQAVVTAGSCTPATTPSVEMTVSGALNAGVIADAENSVCTGTNSTLLTLTGANGSIQWQSSTDDITFADIPGETGTTYTATDLTATSFYRVVVSGGVCPPVQSASVVIDVFPVSVPGSVSGGGTVCEGSDVLLTLTGNLGTIQWQSSSDDITFADISGATSATYNVTNVTGTTYYRAFVKSGACSAAATASVMVASGGSTTWNGTAWSNGTPTSTVTAYISGNYNQAADITACSLVVNSNAVVVIPTGYDVTLNGALTVSSGSFTLENAANLLQNTNAANTGNIIVKRNSSLIRRQDYTLWSSPVAGQNLLAFSPFTVVSPTSRFYQYNSSTNLYNSITSPGAVSFNDAQGYLIRVANNHPAFPWLWNGQFTGVPHNGDYTYNMSNGGAGLRYNLVGNPYPSPISMMAFVTANSAQITQTLYFWRETNGNINNNPYCIWSPAGGGTFVSNGEASVINPQGVIETGQGFFVEASAGGSAVSFTNAMRVGNNANQFFRHAGPTAAVADEASKMWLNVTNASGAFCQTAIVYADDATDGLDPGIDAKLIVDAATQLYTMVDGEKLSIQSREPFDTADIVPVVFKATTAGTYSIAIDHVEGLFATGQVIYLKDNMTGTQHLLSDGAYSFTTDAGEFASRFEVMYQTELGTVNPTLDNTVTIIKNNGAFAINSGIATMDNVKVFDIRGRLLLELKDINAAQAGFSVNGTDQVLIVKIKAVDGQEVTRKVIN